MAYVISDDCVISFITPTYSENENVTGSNAVITVVRTGATNTIVSVDYESQDGTATAGLDYIAVRNILTFLPGEAVKTFLLPIIADQLIEGNETVLLSLTNATTGGVLGLSLAVLTIVDNDSAPGEFDFSSPVYGVNEYDTNVTITVLRYNGSSGIVSVHYSTLDGSAHAGADYAATAGTLAFFDGEIAKTFNIPLAPDHVPETNETVILTLTTPGGGATLGITNTATLVITNNNLVNGNLNFSATNYTVSESNLVATITVTRTLGNQGIVSVQYATFDGTAFAGTNYLRTNGTVSWANGDTAPKTFNVTIFNDNLVQGDKSLGLLLLNPTGGATLGPIPAATLTIIEDDTGPGFLGFSSPSYSVAESATNAVITVVRSFGSTGTVAITWSTADGTARNGLNYSGGTNVLTFGPGETNKSFTIPIIDIASVDVDKTVNLALSQPVGASTNGQIIAAVLTIVENTPPAGSIDAGFNNLGANNQIYVVQIQTNNSKIFAGGDFTQFNALPRNHIVRLLPSGGVDTTFDPVTNVNQTVQALAIQSDGSVLIGGSFTAVGNRPISYLAALLADGTVNTNFLAGLSGVDNFVYSVSLQSEKIVFSSV